MGIKCQIKKREEEGMESEERGKKGNAEVFNRIPLVGLSKIDGWLLP